MRDGRKRGLMSATMLRRIYNLLTTTRRRSCCRTTRAPPRSDEMKSDDVTLLYTMRAPPMSAGMRTDDVMGAVAVKLTRGMCTISWERESDEC